VLQFCLTGVDEHSLDVFFFFFEATGGLEGLESPTGYILRLVAFLISTLAVHCVEGCFGRLSYSVSAGARVALDL